MRKVFFQSFLYTDIHLFRLPDFISGQYADYIAEE
jgi:hypothetical protein